MPPAGCLEPGTNKRGQAFAARRAAVTPLPQLAVTRLPRLCAEPRARATTAAPVHPPSSRRSTRRPARAALQAQWRCRRAKSSAGTLSRRRPPSSTCPREGKAVVPCPPPRRCALLTASELGRGERGAGGVEDTPPESGHQEAPAPARRASRRQRGSRRPAGLGRIRRTPQAYENPRRHATLSGPPAG